MINVQDLDNESFSQLGKLMTELQNSILNGDPTFNDVTLYDNVCERICHIAKRKTQIKNSFKG